MNRWGVSSRLQSALLMLPALVLAERAWDRRWITDDGFINLRVVRMILEGHGPVFNAGERVEVTTSPLWVWILTLGDVVLPLRLEWIAVVLGLVLAVGGLSLATFGAARLQHDLDRGGLLIPVGALVLAAIAPIWDFSTSGLEGGLTFGWLGLVGWLLASWTGEDEDSRFGWLGAGVVGVGPLVRPDLALVTGVVLAAVLFAQWPTDTWRHRLRLLGATLAVPFAYEIFRMGYFGSLVPNTALAKNAGQSRWGTGFAYFQDVLRPYWLYLPLAILVGLLVWSVRPALARARAGGSRRALVAFSALPVAALVHATYIIRLGGDYMHGRLLLPSLFAFVVPLAAVPLPALKPTRAAPLLTGAAVGVGVLWAIVCVGWLRSSPSPNVAALEFSSDARQGAVRESAHEHPVTVEEHMATSAPDWTRLDPDVEVFLGGVPVPDARPPNGLRTPAYSAFGVGLGGYVFGSDVYVIDMLGLADPVTSRFEREGPGNPGHEKPLPAAWLAAYVSTDSLDPALLPAPALVQPIYESAPDELDDDADAAREALSCPDLEDLEAAVSDRLTPGRFLRNLLAAPRLTRINIPPDPHRAVESLCDDTP